MVVRTNGKSVNTSDRWQLDLVDERLWDGLNAIKLTPKAFRMLRYFASHPRRLVTKDELLDAVWGDTCVTEGLVKDYVADLRRALRDSAKEPDYIETVHGRGYRLIGEISLLNNQEKSEAHASLKVASPNRAKATIPTIAVLPFTYVGTETRWELLTSGLCADIIYDLTRYPDLQIIAYKTAMWFKDSKKSTTNIGHELGVDYLVDGSIQDIGSSVRIISNLIDATSGSQLWSDRLEDDTSSLFKLQDKIVEHIATSLSGFHGEIVRAERKRLGRRSPSSLEAYELYLLGYECETKFNRPSTEEGIEYINEAIALDPTFARSWTVLGWLCNNAVDNQLYDTSDELYGEMARRGRDAVVKAAELDPRDPIAIVERGALFAREGDLVSASELFERAIDIGANNVDALALLAKYVAFVLGRTDEAARMLDRAFKLNPNAPDWYYLQLTRIAYFNGEYSKVLDASKRAVDIIDTRIFEILATAQVGNIELLRTLIDSFRNRFPNFDAEFVVAAIPLVNQKHIQIYREGLSKARLIQPADKHIKEHNSQVL